MYVLRPQTCIVWFSSLFSEGLMCMRQNFKLFCCAAYILNLIVSIYLSCWPNLWCSGVFSAEFRSFRKNSAKPDISRKYGSASRILLKNPAEGSNAHFGFLLTSKKCPPKILICQNYQSHIRIGRRFWFKNRQLYYAVLYCTLLLLLYASTCDSPVTQNTWWICWNVYSKIFIVERRHGAQFQVSQQASTWLNINNFNSIRIL